MYRNYKRKNVKTNVRAFNDGHWKLLSKLFVCVVDIIKIKKLLWNYQKLIIVCLMLKLFDDRLKWYLSPFVMVDNIFKYFVNIKYDRRKKRVPHDTYKHEKL